MKAYDQEDGLIAVSGARRVQTFARIWAGIGWPDKESGYMCAVGERPDGRYHALWEHSGGLWELGEAALRAKDRFLIECFWVDSKDSLATSYVRTIQGLCFYDRNDGDKPLSRGTLFQAVKDRAAMQELPTATVRPVPERVTDNFRSALEKTRGIIMNGNILIHDTNCPKLVYTIRQPLEDLVQSPVMKGLVWVVAALEAARGCEASAGQHSDPWYGNFSRDNR